MNVRWEEHGWEQLAPGVGRRRLPGWDATVGLVLGEDAVLLYDTGSTLREGAGIRAQARALAGGRRVTHIALSHPHFDHVLGTAVFSGAEVYGATGLAESLRRDREALRDEAVRHGVPAAEAAEAVDVLVTPRHAVSGERALELGGRRVLLAEAGPGHTAHDLALLVTGERAVVFCGDLVEESGEPQAGSDAVPDRWPAALDRLLELGGEDAVYVPGHGAAVDAAFVRAQRDTLAVRFGTAGTA
ncbi:MBL fold metallo-hydrolase [Streptomyces sp. NBC_01498]|uniref:MBL fold metallo-hydrolase n=1 Tax=Streptomyces sp. NBC_01498 TaxID=2975870 RepID=UPI002E7B19A2|nr:MBL fold metallo-hydrolase [Streptomyces sp. NBC_01498]WTL26971.1 MBL fold metallo-hydrolase [Streptomyces sp. NBC_01498]